MGAGRGSWEKVTPRERHAVRGEREILMRKLMRKLQSGKLPAKWRPEPPAPLTVTMHWGRATVRGGELSHSFFIITPLEHNSKLVSVPSQGSYKCPIYKLGCKTEYGKTSKTWIVL